MRIVVDIDGTICEIRRKHQSYAEVCIVPEAKQKIIELKRAGHYVILHTARHMKTCKNDVNQVREKVGSITENWLQQQGVPYDELHFGKPYADVYIDDLGHPFEGWGMLEANYFNDKFTNILIPMAGLGTRFKQAGYTGPKPLIDVMGKPMIVWAMESFDYLHYLDGYQFIFVILRSDDEQFQLASMLQDLFGKQHPVHVVILDEPTQGQASTCLAAEKFINSYQRLIIYNCDTISTSLLWDEVLTEDPDGILPYFEADSGRYSYMRVDEHGYVTETAEKVPISKYASNGLYYFKRGQDFVRAAKTLMKKQEKQAGEFYVAPVYNELISLGKTIRAVPIKRYDVLGTPEELDAFIKKTRKE